MGALAEVADAIMLRVYMLGEEFTMMVEDHWAEKYLTWNSGQAVIYDDYMEMTIGDFLSDASASWPWIESWMLVDGLFTCYDMDVMERAFSDSILNPVDRMDQMIYHGQELYETAQMLELLDALLPFI